MYVPVANPLMIAVVPGPVVVVPPGVLVNVQVPDDGKPLSATDPVAVAQVGCVIVPTTGAVGANGCALMTMLADDPEIHPAALVTVHV